MAIFPLIDSAFRALSLLLHDSALGIGISCLLILAVTYSFKEEKKLTYLISALLIALLLGLFFKSFLQSPRPCLLLPGLIPCPDDYSLPSMHSLLGFTLAIVSLGNRSFPIYLLYALLLAAGRLYLGVHTVQEVFAGLALAFFACVLSEMLWRRMRWKIPVAVHVRHDSGKRGLA